MPDHYAFMVQELDAVRIGLDSLHAERDRLVAENAQLRRDLAEMRERLAYHMRIGSDRACVSCS